MAESLLTRAYLVVSGNGLEFMRPEKGKYEKFELENGEYVRVQVEGPEAVFSTYQVKDGIQLFHIILKGKKKN